MPEPRRAVQVYKFGGASLADAEAIRHAAGIVRQAPGPVVVVVSAMAGVTDGLLAIATQATQGHVRAAKSAASALRRKYATAARELGPNGSRSQLLAQVDEAFEELERLTLGLAALRELTPRSQDQIVARGEYLAARLFCAALSAARVRSDFVEPTDVIQTDGTFGLAAPDLRATDRSARRVLLPLLRRRIVPVVPGFIGAGPGGEVATLGRGGADLTATLIGRALGAQEVSLWKDVPGLLTADPRVVANARVIPQLNLREAAELAYYGAKVLHPRALIPVREKPIAVRVRPFADPASPGTEISRRRTLSAYPVKALSAAVGQAVVTVTGNGMLGVPGIAARTFAAVHRDGISVSLISQASSEHSICISVPEDRGRQARARLLETFSAEIARGEIDGVELQVGAATLAVVGFGIGETPGVAARVFSALARGSINVIAVAQGSSDLNLSVVLDGREAGRAQQLVHDEFQLSKIGGGTAHRSTRADVILLGFGQVGRSLAAELAKTRRPALPLRVVSVIDRAGYVFDPEGFSGRRLLSLIRAKERGKSLALVPGGHAGGAEEAVAYASRHALTRPILADLTASETGPVIKAALATGIDIVLANKRPLAASRKDYDEIWALAREHGRRILHEATVGAGLPIIDTYHKLVDSGDRIVRVEGCPSGTLGFLFGEMSRGRPLSEAVLDAMRRGYTEPDPREDLSGMDVARKALILGRLLGFRGELRDIDVESLVPPAARKLPLEQFLRQITRLDDAWRRRAEQAREAQGVLRYRATVSRRQITVGVKVVRLGTSMASLDGTDNQFIFTTERYQQNPLVITGPGAGSAVTAGGILNDLLELATP